MAAKVHFFFETTKQKKKKDQTGLKKSVKSVYESVMCYHHYINDFSILFAL